MPSLKKIKNTAQQKDKLARSYFDLIIKTILNEVYYPGEHVAEGKVWPECPAMSMIGKRRLENVLDLAIEKIEQDIPGDFIEAGIWKGGVIALMSAVLKVYGETERQVYGADSFQGIPPAKPELYPADKAHVGCDKLEILSNNSRAEVEKLLSQLDLLTPQVSLVEGWFKDSLADIPNEKFALIRLDGDSYESTMQALQALYPKLSDGGSIIVDNYYSWEGCRTAVDEWRAEQSIKEPLIDIDWTGVYWTKPLGKQPGNISNFSALPKRVTATSEEEIRLALKEGLLTTPQVVVGSAWIGHLPFLTSLIGVLKPRRYVELGVHNGYSFFGAAQAVETHGIETEIIGIDLWLGDEHAGCFNAEVFNQFTKNRAEHFPSTKIIRQDFSNAVHLFDDESIDLLHIDGLHTYEAVKSDFDAWMPKVSEGGVILLHDTKVFRDGFGVWKLWEELQDDYICYEFSHFHGLGVVVKLKSIDQANDLSGLFTSSSMTSFERAGETLGNFCHSSLNASNLQKQVHRLTQEKCRIEVESRAHTEQLRQESVLRGQLAEKITGLENDKQALTTQVASLSEALAAAGSASRKLESALELESLLRGQVAEKITQLEKGKQLVEATLFDARNHREQLQHQLDASNAQLQTADKDKQTLTAQVDSLKTNAEQLQHQLDACNAQLQTADKDKQTLTAQVNSLQVNVDQRFEELAKLSQHLTEIEGSRLTSKIRSAGKLLRPRKS